MPIYWASCPKIGRNRKSVVSRFLHFQRLASLKMAGHPAPHGKRRQVGASRADIWLYSAKQWSPEQADRYVEALVGRFEWLCYNPALWKPRPELADGLHGYRQQSHVIYFRPGGDGPELIEIVRILHARMMPEHHV
jgi:toxin ParE1/3/4